MNDNKKLLFKFTKKKNLLNRFMPRKNNISSIFTGKKFKWEDLPKDNFRSQRYIKINEQKQSKLNNLTKRRKNFLDNSLNRNKSNINYLSSYYCKSSSRMTLNDMDNTDDDESSKNSNYEKSIIKALNSFKIKKEISSFLYSSPDKQKRLINFLSDRFSHMKSDINKIPNNYLQNNESNFNDNKLLKIRRKLIKIKENENKKLDESMIEEKNEDDEDKTNLKEFSLFSLFIGKKKDKIQNKIKYMRNDKKKLIECWDNNLLKNVLPKNIKNHYELNNLKSSETNNKDNSFGSKNGDSFYQNKGMNILNTLNINPGYNNLNRYKYQYKYKFQQDKKERGFRNNYYLLNYKRLIRSSSNL